MAEMITCSACGTQYAPEPGRSSCQTCPLHSGCAMACCPNCGTSNINPSESGLARWLQRLFKGERDAVSTAQTKLES